MKNGNMQRKTQESAARESELAWWIQRVRDPISLRSPDRSYGQDHLRSQISAYQWSSPRALEKRACGLNYYSPRPTYQIPIPRVLVRIDARDGQSLPP